MRRKLIVIGIGVGDPEYLTFQAAEAIQRCDLFLIPGKGEEKADLVQLRLDIIERIRSTSDYRLLPFEVPKRRVAGDDYLGAVDEWHDKIADAYAVMLEAGMTETETAGLLVWGDPALYDSTLRILTRLEARPAITLEYEVIPGITAVQALAARHKVTLNDIGEPFLTTTGRKLGQEGMPGRGNAVVMLDGETAFRSVDPDLEIYWGAYLGTPDEILIAGRVGDVADEIVQRRSEARARKGWIMDTYLLKRPERA